MKVQKPKATIDLFAFAVHHCVFLWLVGSKNQGQGGGIPSHSLRVELE